MEKTSHPHDEDPNATKPPARPLSPSQFMAALERNEGMDDAVEQARVRRDQERAVTDIQDTGIPKIPVFEDGLVESLTQEASPSDSLEHTSGRRGPPVVRIPRIPYPKRIK